MSRFFLGIMAQIYLQNEVLILHAQMKPQSELHLPSLQGSSAFYELPPRCFQQVFYAGSDYESHHLLMQELLPMMRLLMDFLSCEMFLQAQIDTHTLPLPQPQLLAQVTNPQVKTCSTQLGGHLASTVLTLLTSSTVTSSITSSASIISGNLVE